MSKRFLAMMAFLAVCGLHAAEALDPGQIPGPVQKALTTEGVREVRIHTVNGRPVFDVELEIENAPNAHLRISTDGKILHDSRQSDMDGAMPTPPVYVFPEYTTPVPVPQLRIDEVPPAVRETIQKHASGSPERKLGAITSGQIDGRPAYRVEFRERGRNPRVYVAEDGTVLRPLEKLPALGLGTMFSETPPAVQDVIRREATGGEIVKIKKEGRRNEPVSYRVDIQTGETAFQLEIAEDGKITRDSRKAPAP